MGYVCEVNCLTVNNNIFKNMFEWVSMQLTKEYTVFEHSLCQDFTSIEEIKEFTQQNLLQI